MTEHNLGVVFDAIAAAVPDAEAVVWRDRRITYRQLAERTNQVANLLLDHGLTVRRERDELAGHESGQAHLALYLHNGNEYLEGMLGAYKARVAPFNVNYRYVADELEYLLRDSGAEAIIYHSVFAPVLADVRDRLPNLRLLLQVDDGSGNALLDGAFDHDAAVDAASTAPPPVDPSPDDLYILYTGGTTGMPKGVLWRQADIFMAAMGGRPFGSSEETATVEAVAAQAVAGGGIARMMVVAPLMHGAAQWAGFNCFTNGGALVMPDDVTRLDPADVWRVAARERVVSLPVVGDAVARPLVDELERGGHDASGLFVIGNGGAALSPTLKARILELIPQVTIIDSVGASETGIQLSHNTSAGGEVTSGTFGLQPGAVVIDEDLTALLEPGHDGLGWLGQRGRVPLGYLGDEAKTARTFPVIDGVRYSIPGDRARLLADGQFELLGRDSVCINSGGEKIFAEEVERALTEHPDVYDVIVVGRPSERWGSEVVAVVQAREDAVLDDESLAEVCRAHLAGYKVPKAFVHVDHVVRSPSGKADYRWAAAQAAGTAAD